MGIHNAAEPQPKNGNGKNDASNRQVAKNAKNGNSKINLELPAFVAEGYFGGVGQELRKKDLSMKRRFLTLTV